MVELDPATWLGHLGLALRWSKQCWNPPSFTIERGVQSSHKHRILDSRESEGQGGREGQADCCRRRCCRDKPAFEART